MKAWSTIVRMRDMKRVATSDIYVRTLTRVFPRKL